PWFPGASRLAVARRPGSKTRHRHAFPEDCKDLHVDIQRSHKSYGRGRRGVSARPRRAVPRSVHAGSPDSRPWVVQNSDRLNWLKFFSEEFADREPDGSRAAPKPWLVRGETESRRHHFRGQRAHDPFEHLPPLLVILELVEAGAGRSQQH